MEKRTETLAKSFGDLLVHRVRASNGSKAPAGCGPEERILDFACGSWEYAFTCEPGYGVTCPECKEESR